MGGSDRPIQGQVLGLLWRFGETIPQTTQRLHGRNSDEGLITWTLSKESVIGHGHNDDENDANMSYPVRFERSA